MSQVKFKQVLTLPVMVAALGYFVDIFDLYLFGAVRVASLKSLGLTGDALMSEGIKLLNAQMAGVLIGGIFWGVLGDRKGRVAVLFGSILTYSLANLANAFVDSVWLYAILRFIAGFGLAGELGVAITLVSEVLPQKTRGYGTTIVASLGLAGSIAAGLLSEFLPWRACYITGGVLGLALLALRYKLADSAMFESARTKTARFGSLRLLLSRPQSAARYVALIMLGLPIWFIGGIIVTFSPEFAQALGNPEPVTTGRALFFTYSGVVVGDVASGLISQWMESRRKVIAGFLVLCALSIAGHTWYAAGSAAAFYASCVFMGFTTGFWAVFVTFAAEQFGTNLRATVTTSVPNFVRGAVVPMTLGFAALRQTYSLVESTAMMAGLCFVLAFCALAFLPETFTREMDFLER